MTDRLRPGRRTQAGRRGGLSEDRQRKHAVDAVSQLRGHTVESVAVRDDCRLLRVAREDGRQRLLSPRVAEDGKARFDADIVTSRCAADLAR